MELIVEHVGIFARRPGARHHSGFGADHLGLRQSLLAIAGIGDDDRPRIELSARGYETAGNCQQDGFLFHDEPPWKATQSSLPLHLHGYSKYFVGLLAEENSRVEALCSRELVKSAASQTTQP